MEIKDYIRETRRFRRRAWGAGALVVVLLLVIFARLVYLQILAHEHYTTLSQDNRVKVIPLPPTRGLIYDRSGRLVARNRPSYSLEIIPERVDDMEQTLRQLGGIIEIRPSDLERFNRLRRQKRRFENVPIRVNLDLTEAARFAVVRHRFPGVDVRASLSRHYPESRIMAHVLGYVGRVSEADLEVIDQSDYAGTTHIGKIGVERTYEDWLHGTVGLQQVEVNALGRVVRVLENTPPVPGRNLRLHIDTGLQEVALEAFGEYDGAAVAIDPNTGGVLALVSKPGFDPNLFVEGISSKDYETLREDERKPLYNRALRGQYPPGSSVKPFIGLGGLETTTIAFDSAKYCPGFYQLPGHEHRYRDWKKTGHGLMDLDAAITQSCDVFFYQLAYDMGIDRLHDYLDLFSFGRKTGIDLVGELPGLLPSRDWKRRSRRQPWYPGETLITGIGQGYYLATPLQLAAATAAVANGGIYRIPQVAASVEDNETGESRTLYPRERPIPITDAQNWFDVQQAMMHVVEGARGTAKRIRNASYRIAGKTGTAQVFTVKQDEEYVEEEVARKMRDHALFIAYAPIEAPRIAVSVIVENGGHGGAVAAPIARRIMDAYLLGKTNSTMAEVDPETVE